MSVHDVMAVALAGARDVASLADDGGASILCDVAAMSTAMGRLRRMIGGRLAALSVNGQPAIWRLATVAPVASMPPLIWMANGAALRVDRVTGLPIVVDDAEPGAALAALDGLEPVLVALEQRLGLSLEPVAIAPLPGDFEHRDAVSVEVRLSGAGDVILATEITLILPQDIALAAQPAGADAVYEQPSLLASRVPVPVALVVAGPRLPIATAASLAKGDLLMVGPGAVSASLIGPGGAMASGRFDPGTARFTCGWAALASATSGDVPMPMVVAPQEQPGPPVGTPAAPDPDAVASPAGATEPCNDGARVTPSERLAAFAVPTAIGLGERLVPFAELAALAPGCVMMLDHLVDQAEVSITVGGRAIAYGHFVRAGDAHAVMISRLAASAVGDLSAAEQ